ncbi:Uncharacterised protein [Legionella cherrii]|uniref:Uncharacterized protein n=1 Tax=Legionella cherrii TaxID=28084 RepID=A0ABY6T504_9GAMM|nr:Uncharacterised protein [Legionella cherrii]
MIKSFGQINLFKKEIGKYTGVAVGPHEFTSPANALMNRLRLELILCF